MISFNALAVPALNNTDNLEHIMKQVHTLQQEKALPNVPVNYIVKADKEIASTRVIASADLQGLKNCEVNIQVNSDMNISYTGTKQNRETLKEVTNAINSSQELIRTEYITYHETAHCKMYEIKDAFQHENLQVQNTLNQFFKFSSTSYITEAKAGNASVYYMLHENFADSFAFIQLLKSHGPTQDVLETMQKIQIERSDAANEYNKDGLIVHNTQFALKEILKEENIQKILATDNQADLQEMALNFANKGLWQSVATYTKSSGGTYDVVNMESVQSGILFLVNHTLYSHSDTIVHKEQNINVNLENNKLYEVSQEIISELKKDNDFSKMNEKQIHQFLKNNQKQIEKIIQSKMDSRFDMNKTMTIAEFVSHHIDNDASQYSSTPKNIAQIKSDGIEDLKTIHNIAEKFNKNNALNKMQAMRSQHLHNNNIRVVNNAP